jgi:hypothetical protein
MARLLLDPWSPDFDAPIQMSGSEGALPVEVDPNVETEEWRPIKPQPTNQIPSIHFVDGIRRVEARVLSRSDDGAIIHGAFASLAAGAVGCTSNLAELTDSIIRRRLLLTRGAEHTQSIRIGACQLCFEGAPTAGYRPEDLTNELQNLMRAEEAAVAESLLARNACVFADGPLNYFSAPTGDLIGVIKRIILPYLEPRHFGLLSQLAPGERTPLFSIRDGKYDRYSWFQRLASPRVMEHELAGTIRLEVRAAIGIQRAIQLGNLAAALLPRFASSPVRDSRAPQNLVPVGALEQQLRYRIGDSTTITRGIERKLWEGVSI